MRRRSSVVLQNLGFITGYLWKKRFDSLRLLPQMKAGHACAYMGKR
jgi:hypothetical protein